MKKKQRNIQGEKILYSFVYFHTNITNKFHNYVLFTNMKKFKK